MTREKYAGLTLEVRKRRKRDPHYRGYGEGYGGQITWPCGHHMQTVGFHNPDEANCWLKTRSMADQYPECQEEYDCDKEV